MTHPTEFSLRTARSGSLTAGLSAVILIETVAVHFLLAVRHPAVAWLLTALSASAVVYLVRDYQALGRGSVRVVGDRLLLSVGRRYNFELPLANVERVIQPSFRDLPTPGTNQGRDYANLTKPASPNVLIALKEPVRVRLPGGVHRTVRRLSVHLDDPAGFVAAASGYSGGG
jgi:hypothetical protein